MLAELYAVHFHDFDQARQTLIDVCEQPGTTPSQVAVALHRLSDWCLRLRDDPAAARQVLEALCTKYPDTHLARMARLRINQIPETREELLEQRRGKTLHLLALHDDLEEAPPVPLEVAQARERAEQLVDRLRRDPDRIEAREEFARLLADHLAKPEAALDQLDLLLGMDGQPESKQAEWLGLKASWLLRHFPEDPRGRAALEKILSDFPASPQALAARRRIHLLNEQALVARIGPAKPRPRIVIRRDKEAK
jgi:hypothetical protein